MSPGSPRLVQSCIPTLFVNATNPGNFAARSGEDFTMSVETLPGIESWMNTSTLRSRESRKFSTTSSCHSKPLEIPPPGLPAGEAPPSRLTSNREASASAASAMNVAFADVSIFISHHLPFWAPSPPRG